MKPNVDAIPAVRRCLAIDLGASSGRLVLGTWHGGRAEVQLVRRFAHQPEERDGHLYWNLERLQSEIAEGLQQAAEVADGPIDSLAIDGWAVDYVRLDAAGQPLADPFCYRDARTETAMPEVWARIPAERLYQITGIQFLRFNTLYQLYADRRDGLEPGATWMNLPEYLSSWLAGSGRPVAEFTNATHTQMLDAGRSGWSPEIFAAAGLDLAGAPEIVQPGHRVGLLQAALRRHPHLSGTAVVLPSCHDTGSAVAGIPATGEDWAFLSSGTWSLVGAVLDAPQTGAAARHHNFSNEGGIGGSVRFLKNVNGMWLLEECLRAWEFEDRRQANGAPWTAAALIEAIRHRARPVAWFDVEQPDLLLPGNMPERLRTAIRHAGFAMPAANDVTTLAHILFNSLSRRYAAVLQALAEVTGRRFRRLFVVGGGSRNQVLNQMIAQDTGLEVIRGAVESAITGNLAVQAAALEGTVTRTTVAAWAERWAAAEQGGLFRRR